MPSISVVRLSIVALMVASGGLSAASLSGKILNLDGTPRSDVEVRLSGSTLKAITGSDGLWSLSGSTIVQSRQMQATCTPTRHLRVQDGRLHVVWSGRNASGRSQLGTPVAQSSSRPSPARALAGAPDTLVYSWWGRVFQRDTMSNLVQSGIVRYLDTTWNSSIIFGYFTDPRDNNTYRTVKIGTQLWMAENMAYKGAGADTGLWYDNNPTTYSRYGRLYTWAATVGLPDSCNTKRCAHLVQTKHQGICPSGWHVPNDSEWTVLKNFADPINMKDATYLKSTSFWYKTGIGTDIYGFRVLPSGCRNSRTGAFVSVRSLSLIWSATERDTTNAWRQYIDDAGTKISRYYDPKTDATSARCLADESSR